MEKTCKNCGAPTTKEYCEDNYPEVCEHWSPKKPQTNADRIRAMNNESLAYLITTMLAEQEQKITKTLAEAGVDATIIALDFDRQAAIHKEWLDRAAEEEACN